MKFLLDSGDPEEYKKISSLAKTNNSELWGSTTNPTLIAKNLSGQKISKEKAFQLQKEIAFKILSIVPGVVSVEVYADRITKASEMIKQGRDIATWDKRIVVKIPTTIEGFKARTELRKSGVPTNNTLVFSQEQIYAICLHEELIQKEFGPIESEYPPFISPFVGRLDDLGLKGIDLVRYGMEIKKMFVSKTWMLEASVRNTEHVKMGMELDSELITAPAKIYEEWFENNQSQSYSTNLKPIPKWTPTIDQTDIASLEQFEAAIENKTVDISHELTEKGIDKFAEDWNSVIQQ